MEKKSVTNPLGDSPTTEEDNATATRRLMQDITVWLALGRFLKEISAAFSFAG
jgi:hypothetical protein